MYSLEELRAVDPEIASLIEKDAWPHLQHRQVTEVVQRVGDALGNRQIGQEMLP